MTIDADGPPCQGHCPNRGCLEVLASATGIMREANTLADARPAGTLREARGGGAVLDARFVIEHARIGDAEALQVLEPSAATSASALPTWSTSSIPRSS